MIIDHFMDVFCQHKHVINHSQAFIKTQLTSIIIPVLII